MTPTGGCNSVLIARRFHFSTSVGEVVPGGAASPTTVNTPAAANATAAVTARLCLLSMLAPPCFDECGKPRAPPRSEISPQPDSDVSLPPRAGQGMGNTNASLATW